MKTEVTTFLCGARAAVDDIVSLIYVITLQCSFCRLTEDTTFQSLKGRSSPSGMRINHLLHLQECQSALAKQCDRNLGTLRLLIACHESVFSAASQTPEAAASA